MTDTNGNGQQLGVFDIADIDLNADAGQFSALANKLIGLNNSRYDTSLEDQIEPVTQLSEYDVINLCRSSAIARRIVEIYPTESNFGLPVMPKTGYYGVTPEKIVSYINNRLLSSESISLEEAFRTASINARKYGVAYIVLGFDDGSVSMAEPLRKDNLKSLEWIELLDKEQLIADDMYEPKTYQFINTTLNAMGNKKEMEAFIHASRVFRFTAKPYDRLELRGLNQFDSILQHTVAELLVTMKGNKVSNQLLLKKALIYAKISTTAGTIGTNRAKLEERLMYINLLSSIFRMIGLSENEELNAIQIDLSNVDKVLEKNIDALVAASGIVRTNLLGQPAQQGLGQSTSGLENRMEHSRRCSQWAEITWKSKLIQFYNNCCLCPDSPTKGKAIPGLSVEFPSNLVLFPQEWAELRDKNADWAVKHNTLGTVNLNEIRDGFFGNTELIGQLIPNITLDPNYDPEKAKEERRVEEQKLQEQKTLISKDSQKDDATRPQLKLKWKGYTIALQYLPFQIRHKRVLPVGYGYIENLKSPYDNMAFDVYVVPRDDLDVYEDVYLVEQFEYGTRNTDEFKGIIGVSSIEEAQKVYCSVMPEEMMGSCLVVPASELRMMNQKDSYDTCPNYHKVDDNENNCTDCIHARWGDKSNPLSWINCEKYDFEVDTNHVCDDFESQTQNHDSLDFEELEKKLEETLISKDPKDSIRSLIDEVMEDL